MTDEVNAYHGLKSHGTRGRYRQGCPCDECDEANKAYHRDRRQKITETGRVIKRPAWAARLAWHGTPDRYFQGCNCKSCKRAYNLWRRVRYEGGVGYTKKPAECLTDVNKPAFTRLMRDILAPDDEITAAILAKIHKRVQARISREFHDLPTGSPTTAAKEISQMTFEQIKALMQPDVPSLAQTRRKHTPMHMVQTIDGLLPLVV